VADTGHGIPSNIIDQIFEPFFTTRDVPECTGLGLSVCHGIVESHRGSITVHSTVGEGTTFSITLPTLAESAALEKDAAPRESAPAARRPETHSSILVVDADEDLREVLRESLQNRGYVTRSAADGLEAMAAVLGHPVDLVLCDLNATALDGEPLFKQLRDRYPALPIIGLTGVLAEDEAAEALRMGARACLQKPFEIEQLFAQIERVLGSRHVA
jgi:CheY-like chemotaxis protein